MKRTRMITIITAFFMASCTPVIVSAPDKQSPIVPPELVASAISSPMATPSHTSTPTVIPLASLSTDKLVEKFLTEKEIDTSTLSISQRADFSQALVDKLEADRGPRPIWVEGENATGKVTLYHDVEKNKMVTLPGSYTDNQEIIDQNSYRMFVAVSEEEGSGNLQYSHPETGEIVTLPNSADLDWTKIIDDKNLFDGYLKLPIGEALDKIEFFISPTRENKSNFVQAILLKNSPTILTSSQGQYFDQKCLDTIFMRTDKTGKPIYAVRVFVINTGIFAVLKEEGSIIEPVRVEEDFQAKLKSNQVYFIRSTPNQEYVWKNNKRMRIDELKNTTPIDQAYYSAVTNPIPNDGNIILAGDLFIEKLIR